MPFRLFVFPAHEAAADGCGSKDCCVALMAMRTSDFVGNIFVVGGGGRGEGVGGDDILFQV